MAGVLMPLGSSTRPQHRPHFDWERARELEAQGVNTHAIAVQLGVSDRAVKRILDPEVRERMDAYTREYQRSGVCMDCGGPRSRNYTVDKKKALLLCSRCADIARAATVRIEGPDEDGLFWLSLKCGCCGEWKWPPDFPRGQGSRARGGRKNRCKSCDNKARTAFREARKVACPICGGLMLAEADRRRSDRPIVPKGICRRCYQHSDDPRAVAARHHSRDADGRWSSR